MCYTAVSSSDTYKLKNIMAVSEQSLIARRVLEKLNGRKSACCGKPVYQGRVRQHLNSPLRKNFLTCRSFRLAGYNVRHGLSSNLSFLEDNRKENIRRIGKAAKLNNKAGIIVLTAFISPFRFDH